MKIISLVKDSVDSDILVFSLLSLGYDCSVTLSREEFLYSLERHQFDVGIVDYKFLDESEVFKKITNLIIIKTIDQRIDSNYNFINQPITKHDIKDVLKEILKGSE